VRRAASSFWFLASSFSLLANSLRIFFVYLGLSVVDEVKRLEPQRARRYTKGRKASGSTQKAKPGGLARLFSFITFGD
jgi:hypothetical protein